MKITEIIGLILIMIPICFVAIIEPLYNMIDCIIHGGDWQYYRDKLLGACIITGLILIFCINL